jgi:hypothetical protein
MVSHFAKPQIGQTSSDSRMGVFTANLEDGISADYTDYADYSVRVKQRDKPRHRDQAESKCGDDPECHSPEPVFGCGRPLRRRVCLSSSGTETGNILE